MSHYLRLRQRGRGGCKFLGWSRCDVGDCAGGEYKQAGPWRPGFYRQIRVFMSDFNSRTKKKIWLSEMLLS